MDLAVPNHIFYVIWLLTNCFLVRTCNWRSVPCCATIRIVLLSHLSDGLQFLLLLTKCVMISRMHTRESINSFLSSASGIVPACCFVIIVIVAPFISSTQLKDRIFLCVLSGWWLPVMIGMWFVGYFRKSIWMRSSAVGAFLAASVINSILFLTTIGRAVVVSIPPFPGAILPAINGMSVIGTALSVWILLRHFQLLEFADTTNIQCSICMYPRVSGAAKCPECGSTYVSSHKSITPAPPLSGSGDAAHPPSEPAGGTTQALPCHHPASSTGGAGGVRTEDRVQ